MQILCLALFDGWAQMVSMINMAKSECTLTVSNLPDPSVKVRSRKKAAKHKHSCQPWLTHHVSLICPSEIKTVIRIGKISFASFYLSHTHVPRRTCYLRQELSWKLCATSYTLPIPKCRSWSLLHHLSKLLSNSVQGPLVREVDIGLVGNCLRKEMLSLVVETDVYYIVFATKDIKLYLS